MRRKRYLESILLHAEGKLLVKGCRQAKLGPGTAKENQDFNGNPHKNVSRQHKQNQKQPFDK